MAVRVDDDASETMSTFCTFDVLICECPAGLTVFVD